MVVEERVQVPDVVEDFGRFIVLLGVKLDQPFEVAFVLFRDQMLPLVGGEQVRAEDGVHLLQDVLVFELEDFLVDFELLLHLLQVLASVIHFGPLLVVI